MKVTYPRLSPSTCDDAIERIDAAIELARTESEYASGYNSHAWVHGRLEGLRLARKAAQGVLRATPDWSKEP